MDEVLESKMIENCLVKLPVKHVDKLRIGSELLDFRSFFQSILITDKIHEMQFGDLAQPISVQQVNIFFQVPVNGSQVIRKLSQDFLYHSFS